MKESFPSADVWEPEDIIEELRETDPELLRYIKLLPEELWNRHFQALQKIAKGYADEAAESVHELRVNYILGIVQSREKAIETFETLDPEMKENTDPHVFGEKLQAVLLERGNLLGSGMTARVKSLNIHDRADPIAVKYLLTPTEKTLSVEGEYDMSHEVHLVTDIEAHEREAGVGKRISVPHPLFYYKRGSLQCYGMEQVRGFTLEELTNGSAVHLERKDAILRAIEDRYATEESQKALHEEADAFVRAMHEVCLHGDIKFGNMMADEDGRIYIIDFGQAVTVNQMLEDTREQYENLQDMERAQVRISIDHLLRFSKRGSFAEAA